MVEPPMLTELAIRDFAIIDELRIEFGPGLNALTGETGAGKSILIDAVGAVLGDRIGVDVVRTGATSAWVEASFDMTSVGPEAALVAMLDEFGIEADDEILVLSREVHANGRSVVRVNGRTATVGLLSRIGSRLVDVHGQSDHLSLLRPHAQLDLLDRYAGVLAERQELARLVDELRTLQARIDDIAGGERERARQIDLLRFQVEEIAGANVQPGEEESLLAERVVLLNAERLATESAAVHSLLAGDDVLDPGAISALEGLRQAGAMLTEVATIDNAMQELATRLTEIVFLVEDITAETRAYRDRIEADPGRLAALEERLDDLRGLKRKYGASLAEVIEFGDRAAAELEALTGDGADLETLQPRANQLRETIGELAGRLSRARRTASETLASEVETAMAELNMGRAVFRVEILQQKTENGVPAALNGAGTDTYAVDATGIDRVGFMIAPNAGEALKPLSRIASGGETARLMLALKSILSRADATPTLIFDEVDVGVGGRSGQVVGEKLWHLAMDHQVVVITHLPQIAAFADSHFRIAKTEQAGRVVSRIAPIVDEARLDELAAMLDGLPVTAAAQQSAREMLERVAIWTSREAAVT
ncbi:MAG: DNA repair protein RecN [Chloroflexota bacterium]|nr:DNA repair protein RecN [Chloroflexota bacterium]